MDRNPGRKFVERYGSDNPPPTEADGRARFDAVTAELARVKSDLEHKRVDDFGGDSEAFGRWRQKAISAASWIQREQWYLKRWLGKREKAADKQERQQRGEQLSEIARQVRERAKELAAEIGLEYRPIYSEEHRPDDMPAARERMAQLTAIRGRIQDALNEITAAWTEHPLRRDDLTGVKQPLVEILHRIEAEASMLKVYFHAQEADRQFQVNRKAVCVRALLRAVSEGFVLTEEEAKVLDKLQADVGGILNARPPD